MDRHLEELEGLIESDPRAETNATEHAEFVAGMRATIQTWPDTVRATVTGAR